MFGLGITEIVFILAIALIVIGPKNLPKMARTLGSFFGQVQRMSTDLSNTIREEAINLDPDNRKKEEATVVSATPISPEESNQDKAPPLPYSEHESSGKIEEEKGEEKVSEKENQPEQIIQSQRVDIAQTTRKEDAAEDPEDQENS